MQETARDERCPRLQGLLSQGRGERPALALAQAPRPEGEMMHGTASSVAGRGIAFLVGIFIVTVGLMILLTLVRWAVRLIRRVRR